MTAECALYTSDINIDIFILHFECWNKKDADVLKVFFAMRNSQNFTKASEVSICKNTGNQGIEDMDNTLRPGDWRALLHLGHHWFS